jgi:hypothetical protein
MSIHLETLLNLWPATTTGAATESPMSWNGHVDPPLPSKRHLRDFLLLQCFVLLVVCST